MEYKEYKLSEISKGNRGTYGIGASAVEYNKDLYTYLRITDIKEDGTLDYSNLKSVDDNNAKKYILQKGDIVFARTGNSTGKSYYYDGEIDNLVYAGFLIKFSLDTKLVNPKFVKYYTMTNKYKNWVKEVQTGSTRGNINEKMYGNMIISLPSRDYQNKMVALLEKIDKKIELNNKINENLYEMIHQLYNNIFKNKVDWEEIKLENIAEVSSGKRPKEKLDRGKYPIIGANGKMGYTLNYNIFEDVIIIGRVGTLGIVKRYCNKVWASDNTLIIKTEYRNYIENYLKTIDYNSLNRGSTQPLITQSDLKCQKLLFNKNKIIQFESIVQKIVNKIRNIDHENEILQQLRYTLLPKLMSGKINLDKIKI